MWVVTMFDLPVVTKEERKAATSFRKELLKLGFQMVQFSVYFKRCRDQVQADRIAIRLSQRVPQDGKLDILMITDRQYENIVSFHGNGTIKRENPSNLTLF